MGRNLINGLIALTAISTMTSCQKSSDTAVAASAAKSLYVASGSCYSGSGITTYAAGTASRAVTKWATDSGVSQGVFTDLNLASNVSVNTVPQALIDKGSYILMLTENATTMGDRKVFRIDKNNPGTYITYANDPSAFTNVAGHITKSMAMDTDQTLLFSKSMFIEKLNTLGVRVIKGGANPWVNSTGVTAVCFPAAAAQIQQIALMTPFTGMSQGKLIYIHAGATAISNRIGVVQRTGLTSTVAADCAGGTATGVSTVAHTNAPNLTGPVALAGGTGGVGPSITSMVYIPTAAPALTTGKLLVTYSAATPLLAFDNNTNFNYGIVMWDITESSDTAVTINNPVIIWRDESIVWAPSSMAYDSTNNSLYVAVGGSPSLINQTTQNFGYNIEKFTLDISTPKLTRVPTNNQPFIVGNAYTKCISNMIVGD